MTMLPTRKSVKFYQGEDPEIERRKRLAERLMESGKQPTQSQMVSGFVVPESKAAGLARALSMALGGYQEGAAARAEKQREDNARTTMASAMEAYNRSQAGGTETLPSGESIAWNKADPRTSGQMYANLLMQNEDTAPIGMQTQMGQMQAQMDMANELELARQRKAIESQMTPYQAAMLELKRQENDAMGDMMQPNPTVAPSLGVPVAPMPDMLTGDPKQDAMLRRMTITNAQKRLQSPEALQAANKARESITSAGRFEQLMKDQKTGGMLVNAPLIGGLVKKFDPELAEMEAISADMVPGQRVPGSGATSDFDAKMFQAAVFGPDKPKETNEAIIAATKAQADQDLQYQQFLSDYFAANKNLDQADAYWQQYVAQNPIFDPASPNKPKLNTRRVGYKEYFGGAQLVTPSGGIDEEIDALERELGLK